MKSFSTSVTNTQNKQLGYQAAESAFYAKVKAPLRMVNMAATTVPKNASLLMSPVAALLLLPLLLPFEPEEPELVLVGREVPELAALGTKVAEGFAKQELCAAEAADELEGAWALMVALPAKSQDCALRLVSS
jgi:hypothetical protein